MVLNIFILNYYSWKKDLEIGKIYKEKYVIDIENKKRKLLINYAAFRKILKGSSIAYMYTYTCKRTYTYMSLRDIER